MRTRLVATGAGVLMLLGVASFCVLRRQRPLPAGLSGTIVYVSDRSGMDVLCLRRFPRGDERRLTFLNEPVREPALSPDSRSVAFSMGGRIGLLKLATGEIRFLTLGVDWRDASPSWRSDGQALVVSARRRAEGGTADVHLLIPDPAGGDTRRQPLTDTPGLDEIAPSFGAGDSSVFFVREEGVFRLDLADNRTRRLTGGFRKCRSPRLTSSGRLVYLWSEGKLHGIDQVDLDGKNHEVLTEGGVYYRTLAPSPDGRFLAATFTFDLAFRPLDALRQHREEIRLLDARGQLIGVVADSWRHANHSPDWR